MGFLKKTKARNTTTCMDVVDSYGATLERFALGGRQMNPASELPFEKPLIEAALLELACRGNTSAPESTLKAGYIELSSFQHKAGVDIDWSSRSPPTSRAEIAAFMNETGPKLAAHSSELDFMIAEASRRGAEWDEKLAAMRSAHA